MASLLHKTGGAALLLGSAALLTGTCGYAEAAEQTGDMPEFSGASMGLKVIFYLILIIGLFYFIVKLLAKKNRSFSQGGRSLKSWGGVLVGQNKSVQLVQVGRSLYVVGVGQDVQLLARIDDPEEIDWIQQNSLSQQSFDWKSVPALENWKKKFTRRPAEQQPEEISFSELLQKQLDESAKRKKELGKRLEDEINEDRLNDTQ